MKKSYLVVGAFGLGLVFLSFIINFFFSFNASRTASSFLSELSEGRTAQAYQMTGKTFREVTGEKEFRRMTRRWGLRGYQSLDDWESQTGAGQVTISTNVKTNTGEHVSLIIGLAKEDGEWRIARLQGPPRPAVRYNAIRTMGYYVGHRRDRKVKASDQLALPSNEQVERLIDSTLSSLQSAMAKQDFGKFYAGVSKSWQDETPVNIFERRLRQRNGEQLSLTGLADAKPTFDPPPALENGTLIARGRYLLPDNCVDFHFQYVPENSEWKLVEFWLGFRKPLLEELEDEADSSDVERMRAASRTASRRLG